MQRFYTNTIERWGVMGKRVANVGREKDKNQDHVWHCAIYYNEKQQQLYVI